MFKIEIDDSIFQREMSLLEQQQLPFAYANALNDSMFAVRNAWQAALPNIFDRPTAFTLRAVRYKKATKQTLEAFVYVLDETAKGTPPARYLLSEVTGGVREEKPFEFHLRRAGILAADEYLVPARGAPLDEHGNIPGSLQNAMLSDLQAHPDPLIRSTAESRRKRAVRNRKRAFQGTYFVSRGDRGLPRGIFERSNRAFRGPRASGASGVRMLFIVVKGAPRYRVRFNAQQLAQDAFDKEFKAAFARRMLDALRTARPR
jgi:hypothetical protein